MAAGSATATAAAQAVANIAEDNLCMIRTSFALTGDVARGEQRERT
jgi:hypothetical protein